MVGRKNAFPVMVGVDTNSPVADAGSVMVEFRADLNSAFFCLMS